jgi:hypothetical protein
LFFFSRVCIDRKLKPGTRTGACNIYVTGIYKGAVCFARGVWYCTSLSQSLDLARPAHRGKGDLIEAAAAAAADDLLHTGTTTSPESRRNSSQFPLILVAVPPARRCGCCQLPGPKFHRSREVTRARSLLLVHRRRAVGAVLSFTLTPPPLALVAVPVRPRRGVARPCRLRPARPPGPVTMEICLRASSF